MVAVELLTSLLDPLAPTVITKPTGPGRKIGMARAVAFGGEPDPGLAFNSNDGLPDLPGSPNEAKEPSPSPRRKGEAPDTGAASVEVVVSPVFKMVFLTVVALTVSSAAAATAVAFASDSLRPNQQAIFDTMNTVWKLGVGAIFGLLGGKAA